MTYTQFLTRSAAAAATAACAVQHAQSAPVRFNNIKSLRINNAPFALAVAEEEEGGGGHTTRRRSWIKWWRESGAHRHRHRTPPLQKKTTVHSEKKNTHTPPGASTRAHGGSDVRETVGHAHTQTHTYQITPNEIRLNVISVRVCAGRCGARSAVMRSIGPRD